jgi:hypothetical protein
LLRLRLFISPVSFHETGVENLFLEVQTRDDSATGCAHDEDLSEMQQDLPCATKRKSE